jgi:hypothetical protein
MQPLDHVLLEVDGLERYLSRRGFLKAAALLPMLSRTLSADDRGFLEEAIRVVIPAEALRNAGVDVMRNIEHLLERANADHRARVLRALGWARRISFLYGGGAMPLRARGSRFFVVRRLARAVSVVCLVAFWGDERTLALIDSPPEAAHSEAS